MESTETQVNAEETEVKAEETEVKPESSTDSENKGKKPSKAGKIILRIAVIFIIANVILMLPVASFVEVMVLKGKGNREITQEESMREWMLNELGLDTVAYETKYRMGTFDIPSSVNNGYSIPVFYFSPEGESKGFVVMAHGMNSSHIGIYEEAELFLEEGFEIYSFDERKFGESTWEYMSYGYYEGADVADVFRFACENSPAEGLKGIWGQSLGGAACENALDDQIVMANLDFVVLDCPMGGMDELTGAPEIQNELAGKFNKLICGYSFEQQSPYKQIMKNSAPALLVLAKDDTVIPEKSIKKIKEYFELTVPTTVYESEGSKHADVVVDDKEGYRQALKGFLDSLESKE